MKKLKMKSFDSSSVVTKFNILFVVLSLIPLGILWFLYQDLAGDGEMSLNLNQLGAVLIWVVLGICTGYAAMRVLLKNLVDVTNMTTRRLREFVDLENIEEFTEGEENEISVLKRTFQVISRRLEKKTSDLEMTKKTLQFVLTRVGQGNADTAIFDAFLDLIVESMVDAFGGKKGFLLLLNQEMRELEVKTIYGASLKTFRTRVFPLDQSPFLDVVQTRSALVIPKLQSLSGDLKSYAETFEFPMICAPLILRDKVIGVLAVSGKKFSSTFQEEEMQLLMSLASQIAVALENSFLKEDGQNTYFEVLTALAIAVEAKDSYARGHLDRVGMYCVRIAEAMNLSVEDIGLLRDAAKIHDVGKIGVLDEILAKPSSLTKQEWAMMKKHPEIGEGIIRPVIALDPLCDLVRHHHAKLDGSGYPDGLQGDEIGPLVRILTVADMYDAIVSDRPYRKALSHYDAMRILREDNKDAVDQQVVDALERVLAN